MSKWTHRQLAGSVVCVIVNASGVVRALEGGSIFILEPSKAKGLAEGTKGTVPIGDGMYWTYSESSNRTTLLLNASDGTVIGKIHLFALGDDKVEISYTDSSEDEAIESGLSGATLRDRLNELTRALTSVSV